MRERYDAVIAGGGLAGLTLARQLRREAPAVRVLVLEKRRHPVAEAAFKVGESSVEVGAHYFDTVLGLGPHLKAGHLDKLGIRYFFTHGRNDDIATRVEVGPRRFPNVPSFQLDRGRLENWLLAELRASGVDVEDDAPVAGVDIAPGAHRVHVGRPGALRTVEAGFLVDASGRSGLIRRQLHLTRPVGHAANACWFRMRSRIRVDDWSDDSDWQARVPDGARWLSTNHLMGRGYWVWLIPLGSGSTSIGIVADEALHRYGRISRFDRALEWLREFEPQCAKVVAAHEPALEDFLALKHYAYGSERVFSGDGWAAVGEAGVFTDPFYSPGSDFIAIGNDCAADLVARSARGEDIRPRADAYNVTYLRLFDAFLRLYEGQYRLMGNAQVMTAKAAWDNACYWAITGLLYFQRRYRAPEFLASIEPLMRRFFVLHSRMQQCFRAWDLADANQYEAAFTNVTFVDALFRLQEDLAGPLLDDGALRARLEENFALLERLSRSWQALAATVDPSLARFVRPDGDLMDLSPLMLRPEPVAV
jgi:flavin-dependent dehydrogenase